MLTEESSFWCRIIELTPVSITKLCFLVTQVLGVRSSSEQHLHICQFFDQPLDKFVFVNLSQQRE